MDYNQKIAVPLWQKQAGDSQADLERLSQGSSLARIVDRLRGNPKVHIMHNADDFMAERKSIEALKEAFGRPSDALSIRRTSRQPLVPAK